MGSVFKIEIKFRLGEKEDLDDIMKIFQRAICEMEKEGIYQWDSLYPNEEVLKGDLEKNELYVGIYDGKIVSVYVLNQECYEQYKNGHWQYENATFYVVHRLCVNYDFQHRGIGKKTMIHIENELRKKNIETIRLDAFSENIYAIKMYEKLGYVNVGEANWRKGKFYLLEKKI